MTDDFVVFNIRTLLNDTEFGENALKDILSDFSCQLNPDVDHFLKNNSIEFTKKNQSVTYLVFNNSSGLLGYFTIAIKPISIKCDILSSTMYRKISRVAKYDEDDKSYSLSAYLIAQLGKNYNLSPEKIIDGSQLLNLALNKVKSIQTEVGGMVVFLEAEPKEKLMNFYKVQNKFVDFETRHSSSSENGEIELIQLLRIL